jgi:hypothetical protein
VSGIAVEQVRCWWRLRRPSRPEEVAEFVAFAASDRASVTGTAFSLKNQSLCSSVGGTNRCRPAANAEHDKRPRATMGLANPILAAVDDNGLAGDKGGIVAC